ncbi:hypothetical protein GCM10010270_09440 [Streptomyces violaceus]|nr:hypothetical protein GCM10010270_09440 [Streptomyces janthinus]
MTGLRNGPSRSAWRARAKTRVAYLEAQLEYERVSPRPEERPTLIEGMRGHLERAPTAADEKFGWRSPRSGSTAREDVWSNVRDTLTGEDPRWRLAMVLGLPAAISRRPSGHAYSAPNRGHRRNPAVWRPRRCA